MQAEWFRNIDPEQMRRSQDDAYAEIERLRLALATAEAERDAAQFLAQSNADTANLNAHERDQARAALEEHRIAYTAITAERDHCRQRANSAEARMGNYRADNRRLSEARVTALQMCSEQRERATRLAALEAAARAWVGARALPFETEAAAQLEGAVRALDAAPAPQA